ncbi:MAG: NAD(P)H-hydrate epimerase [Planctomycetota bacterium]
MKTISVAEARAIDEHAIEQLGMPGILLMENASRGVAQRASGLGNRFLILCGPGNNGGDGLAAVRHLGPAATVVALGAPDERRAPDAFLQWCILERAGIEVLPELPESIPDDVVMIDALFGTGLARPIEGRAARWIERFNAHTGSRLAVDAPSGLDADTGRPLGEVAVRATHTVTFEAPKTGLVQPSAEVFVGELSVVPLGLPKP